MLIRLQPLVANETDVIDHSGAPGHTRGIVGTCVV
jgi:hypothetical protein